MPNYQAYQTAHGNPHKGDPGYGVDHGGGMPLVWGWLDPIAAAGLMMMGVIVVIAAVGWFINRPASKSRS